MSIQTEIADGLLELEADFPDTFVWNSTTYACLVGTEERDILAGAYGAEAGDSVTLIVRLSQFGSGTKPQAKERVVFNSRNYTIDGIDKAPNEAFAVYHCEQNR